jgi:mono/diheme cytochrome c family protein
VGELTKVLVITMSRLMLPYLATAAIFTALSAALAQPSEGDPAAGRETATKLCSSCHQVLPIFLPDKRDAPSFQSIADLPSTTGISLYVFLHSSHRNMPNLILSSAETNDLIAYILSLKKK